MTEILVHIAQSAEPVEICCPTCKKVLAGGEYFIGVDVDREFAGVKSRQYRCCESFLSLEVYATFAKVQANMKMLEAQIQRSERGYIQVVMIKGMKLSRSS